MFDIYLDKYINSICKELKSEIDGFNNQKMLSANLMNGWNFIYLFTFYISKN